MGRLNRSFAVTRVTVDGVRVHTDTRADTVTVEEPLEIRVGGPTLTTTMRTPGHDVELLHGFLYGERADHLRRRCVHRPLLCRSDRSRRHEHLQRPGRGAGRRSRPTRPELLRLTPTSSACGVCGTSSIDQIMRRSDRPLTQITLDPAVVVTLPDRLQEEQKQFRRTGGLHAAGAFTLDGEAVVVREDIGRHNAADKVIGHLLLEGRLPADNLLLVMSSRRPLRTGAEARSPPVSVGWWLSAASSLAVELAREAGLALTGFTRGDRFNLYSGELS
ncbi:formate dehydrogenase accessory sulfurtransferase FdhD [Corynebacterium suedekumii]|nr:formate dehydrogenase accessory sulfurtransferase FdhD [Corynebacterium suedekumii]